MTPEIDLFGSAVIDPVKVTAGGKRKVVCRGYARPPGTGPAGESCKTCVNAVATGRRGRYHKCLIIKHRWTHGPGTDILLKSPACDMWRAKDA